MSHGYLTTRQEIQHRFGYKKDSNIWYDCGLLKYFNAKFFGKNQNGGFRFYLRNVQEVDDPTSFIDQVKNLLDDAIAELPYWCANGAEVGGRVVGGSCNFFLSKFDQL
ncbi:Cysteine-rich repeat secretory protein 38, partial [Cucurbita argyrosperma subsp. sororia]